MLYTQYVPFPKTKRVHNLGVFQDSQCLLKEQSGSEDQRRLCPDPLSQLCPFIPWDREVLLMVTYALVTSRLEYYNVLYLGLLINTTQTLQLIQKVAKHTVFILITLLFVQPALALNSFQIHFKMLVIKSYMA